MVRRALSFANVVSVVALFVALGGVSYAAFQLPRNSVGTAQIKRGAVTGSKIKLSSLGTVPSAANATHALTADRATVPVGGLAAGGGATPPSLGGGNAKLEIVQGIVNLTQPGSILVTATPSPGVKAECPGVGCTIHLGLYIDGNPIPNSDQARAAPPNTFTADYTSVQGLIEGVAAGDHTLSAFLVDETTGFSTPAPFPPTTLTAVILNK
jgi:hypothetical protein